MATTSAPANATEDGGGPKYHLNIEGQLFDWDADTITVPQIREIGHMPDSIPVELIDLITNEQRTLAEGEVVDVRPGLGFGKKVKFKRG